MRYLLKSENFVYSYEWTEECDACMKNLDLKNKSLLLDIDPTSTKCPIHFEKRRVGAYRLDSKQVMLCSTDENVFKSKRVFKTTALTILSFINHINFIRETAEDKANDSTKRLLHNIKEMNALQIQHVYEIVTQEELNDFKKISDKKEYVKSCLKWNGSKTVDLILHILESTKNMSYEFTLFDTLRSNSFQLTFHKHIIKKVLLNVIQPFFVEFVANKVNIDVFESNIQSYFDYKTFSCSVFLIMENAKKYVMPGSDIGIEIEHNDNKIYISFYMMSFPILDYEIDKIFSDGFSGSFAQNYSMSGDGIGMFRARKLLSLNSMSISVNTKIKASLNCNKNGFEYEYNCFKITIFEPGIEKREKLYSKYSKELGLDAIGNTYR